MLRLLLMAIILLLTTFISYSQNKGPDITKCEAKILALKPFIFSGKQQLPFNKIEVLDYRYDTSKIGYSYVHGYHQRLMLPNTVAKSVSNYLNQYFRANLESGTERTMLIVIKKLWLQYGATNVILGSKNMDQGSKFTATDVYKHAVCIADIEVFAGSVDTFQALTKINYNFTIEDVSKIETTQLLLTPFDSIFQKVAALDIAAVISPRKKYLRAEIISNYQGRFNLPVLTQGLTNIGIFLTFEDFKKNIVSYPEFYYDKRKVSTEVYATKGDTTNIITKYWAFFDGKDLYVKPGILPFKAVRRGNTFDFFGNTRGQTEVRTYPVGYLTIYSPRSFVTYLPLQVDMETGKVY